MSSRVRVALLVASLFGLLLACSEQTSSGQATPDDARYEVQQDGADSSRPDAADSTRDNGGTADAAVDLSDTQTEWQLESVSLPQAVAGALWANPAVYPEIPLRVAVVGRAEAVTVTVADQVVSATDADQDGVWVASIPISDLGEGTAQLQATATAPGLEPVSTDAQLSIGTAGVQLTVFDKVGFAGAPRIHRIEDQLWISWTDRSDELAEAWMRRIDGAGRWQGTRIRLVGSDQETLYARTAVGNNSIGILYQQHGSPYATYFKMVDQAGTELLPPMSLDPGGFSGAFGGDISFDGSAYVCVWRLLAGGGSGEIRWMRVHEDSGAVTGPMVLAASGDNDPHGGFELFSFVKLATLGETSLVSFVRGRWFQLLEMAVPKSQIARLIPDGTVEAIDYAGVETDFTWHREARIFPIMDGFVAVWSASDLLAPDDNPPNLFYAARASREGILDPDRGAGTLMFDSVDDRDEPFLLAHPEHLGVMAWTDHRAYTLEPASGRIELYVASVGEDLTTGEAVVFPHARFIAGTSQLNATLAGSNVILIWLDERHGGGIVAPRPELWMETAWF